MKKNVGCFITLIFILCFFSSCGGGGSSNNTSSNTDGDQSLLDAIAPRSDLDGDGITNENDPDIDGDGLSNNDEDRYGASAYIVDTDGDGWTDAQEVERFVASENIFNPAIADLPRIELVLKSAPLVKMEYETTTGRSVEYSTATSDSYQESHTTSNSFAHTFGTEHGWSVDVGVTVGWTAGPVPPGFSASFNAGAHGTYTTEDTHEWGTEESYTNARSVESAKSISSSEDLTKTGGSITYSVAFKNTGPIAYSVDTMELAAYKIDRNDPELVGSISQSSNSSFSEFQSFQLNPGQESGIFSFRNDSLYVSDIMSLLEDSSGIICSIAGYTVSMEGVDFTQSGTDVPAKTAKIFIDYGPGGDRTSEQYSVATKTDINMNAKTLFELYNPVQLRDLLVSINIPYNLGYVNPETDKTNNGLISVRGIERDDEHQKYWYVAHQYKEDNRDMIRLYAAHVIDYDFDEISVRTGDTVQLIYSVDGDGDGIPLRIEKILGTSDDLLDSDGDTLSDWDELHPDPESAPKTNPANKDTDGDGILDNEDDDPLVAKISNDATLVNLELSVGTIDFIKDPPDGGGVKIRDYTVTDVVADGIQITPYAAKNACPITITVNGGEPFDVGSDVESDEIPLAAGDNTIVITVTALDGVTEETYTLDINSKLSPVTDFLTWPAGDRDIQLGWAVPDDNRISGMIIRRFERSGTDVMDDATPDPRDYSVNQELGNADVVYDLDNTTVQQTDALLSSDTTYDYEIFTFNKIGSVYNYSDGTRGTCATTARSQAKLHFELYHLEAIKDEDANHVTTEYYWDINVFSVGIDTVAISQKLDHHVSLNANNTADKFYSFAADAITDSPSMTPIEGIVNVDRIDSLVVVLTINIYEHDDWGYDRGDGDDDIIWEEDYEFKYDFNTNTWSCEGEAIKDFQIGPPDQRETTILEINSDNGDCELKIGFWWEEL